MSTQLKLRRGTTAQHSTFTGAEGEVTVDTDKDTLVVHDGTTVGGIPLVNGTRDQTISGIKTFNSSPIVPTPTTATQAANKGYADNAGFPTGTVMLFVQTAAPTGWTKSTTHDNKALRVVSGTASSGGSSTFSTVFSNQTPTITTSGLSAGATTLSTAQMPSHTHTMPAGDAYTCGGTNAPTQVYSLPRTSVASNSTGGGGSHSHSISGSATSSAITLAVQYVDVIIATKN